MVRTLHPCPDRHIRAHPSDTPTHHKRQSHIAPVTPPSPQRQSSVHRPPVRRWVGIAANACKWDACEWPSAPPVSSPPHGPLTVAAACGACWAALATCARNASTRPSLLSSLRDGAGVFAARERLRRRLRHELLLVDRVVRVLDAAGGEHDRLILRLLVRLLLFAGGVREDLA